eukprot:9484422-Pyramimonas_sp.AAC.2
METTGRVTMAPGGNTEKLELYADVGGHPLGAQFDAKGNLYICDIAKVRAQPSRPHSKPQPTFPFTFPCGSFD